MTEHPEDLPTDDEPEDDAGIPDAPRPLAPLIGLAFNRLLDDLLAVVHDAGYPDLRQHHVLNVFRFLGPSGERPARLAERAGVTAQAMSILIADLTARGFVTRQPDPSDRRASIVIYSDRGLSAGLAIERWYVEQQERWVRQLGGADVDAACRVLAEITGGA